MLQDEMDADLAALLGIDTGGDDPAGDAQGVDEVDLSAQGFPPVTKRFEEVPHQGFSDPDYYKLALSGEGTSSQRIHLVFQKYLNTKDPKDRGVYRQQISTLYWDFLASVARKAGGKLPDAKKYLLRFGLLHPALLNPEQRDFFAKIVAGNTLSVPVYYLDEWLKAIGDGSIRPSTTDEAPAARSNVAARLQQLLEKAKGKRDGSKNLLAAKNEERKNLEAAMRERFELIGEHTPVDDLPSLMECYTDSQKRILNEMQDLIKQMLKSDREQDTLLREYHQAEADVETLQIKVTAEGGPTEGDSQAINTEFGTIRQMAKMTVGRQGNSFPILSSEYFRSTPNDVAARENVVSLLARIESIDPEVFYRTYRGKVNRIVPYVVLIPGYGDTGVCWEPFNRFNRATSRGRLAVPLYPKNLTVAVLAAVGDFRWQAAKEKNSVSWMEDGLTGNYYQWFSARKLKGDLKEAFIQDYLVWMTKESEGTQKLDKELRGIFWRHMPFAQPVKEKLKTRSLIYQELYQRDLNRAMSDGY